MKTNSNKPETTMTSTTADLFTALDDKKAEAVARRAARDIRLGRRVELRTPRTSKSLPTATALRPLPDSPLVVSLGMGVDSVAMLIRMQQLGIRPDAILFADTGSEKPETMDAVAVVAEWLASVGFPRITVVRKVPPLAPYRSLYGYCAAGETLPSLAFTGGPMGAGQCSTAWKIEPQVAWLKSWEPAKMAWALDRLVVTAVGYDAGTADSARCAKSTGKDYPEGTHKWFPLRDWGMQREDCKAVIRAELGDKFNEAIGQDTPVKSACFFCPATTRAEVLELADRHPELLLRAVVLEHRALHGRVKFGRPGLGISWNWRELLEENDKLPADWKEQAVAAGLMPADFDAHAERMTTERPTDERPLAKAAEAKHKLKKFTKTPGTSKGVKKAGPIRRTEQLGPIYRWEPKRRAAMKAARVAWLRGTHAPDRGTVPETSDNVEERLHLGFLQIGTAKSHQAAEVGTQ